MSGLEAIGVVASIVGIIGAATKVRSAIADYSTAVRDHEGSIKELQAALLSMNSTALQIQELINETDDKSDQSLNKMLQDSGADLGGIGGCRETLRQLESLLEKYKVADKELGIFSRIKTKSRQLFKPITDADIRRFTLELGAHCAKLSLNIGVDSK